MQEEGRVTADVEEEEREKKVIDMPSPPNKTGERVILFLSALSIPSTWSPASSQCIACAKKGPREERYISEGRAGAGKGAASFFRSRGPGQGRSVCKR